MRAFTSTNILAPSKEWPKCACPSMHQYALRFYAIQLLLSAAAGVTNDSLLCVLFCSQHEIKFEMKTWESSVIQWAAHRGDTDGVWPSTKSKINWTSVARSSEICSLEYCTTLRKRSFFDSILFLDVTRKFGNSAAMESPGHKFSWDFSYFIDVHLSQKMGAKDLKLQEEPPSLALFWFLPLRYRPP